jgi:3-phosphoshikimate 1-carboxyvinyltransferase
MGVEVESENIVEEYGESRGDLVIYGDRVSEPLAPFELTAEDIPIVLDEVPALALLALFADGISTIRGASELRVKESDRLHTIAKQFETFGAHIEEFEDGISIEGIHDRILHNAAIEHTGDHRMAMTFAIAALFASAETSIPDPESVSISYPDFFEHLQQLTDSVRIVVP